MHVPVTGPCPLAPLVLGAEVSTQQWVALAVTVLECVLLAVAFVILRRRLLRQHDQRQLACTDSLIRQEPSALRRLRSPSLSLLCLLLAWSRSWLWSSPGEPHSAPHGVSVPLPSRGA
jgi:heme exporter protein D